MSPWEAAFLLAAAALAHVAVSNAGLLPEAKVKAIAEGLGENGNLLKKIQLSFGQTSPKITVTKAVAGKLALTLEAKCKDCTVDVPKQAVVTDSGGDAGLMTIPYKGDVKLQFELNLNEPSENDDTVVDVPKSRKLETPSAANSMGLKAADLKNLENPLVGSNVAQVMRVVSDEIPSFAQVFGQQYVAPILKKLEDPKLFENDPVRCYMGGKFTFAVGETELSGLTVRVSVTANADKCTEQYGLSPDDSGVTNAVDGPFSASYKFTVSTPNVGESGACGIEVKDNSWKLSNLGEEFEQQEMQAKEAMRKFIKNGIHAKIKAFVQPKLPKMKQYSADELKAAGIELAKPINNRPSTTLLGGRLTNLIVASAIANAKGELEVKMIGSMNKEYTLAGGSRTIPRSTPIELAFIAKPMSIQIGPAAKTKDALILWDESGRGALILPFKLKHSFQESELLRHLMKDLEQPLKWSILKLLPNL